MTDRYSVTLSPAALEDLLNIARFIAEHSGIDRGDAFLDMMLERIDALEHYPFRGSKPKELGDAGSTGFRQIVSGRYRLVYSVIGDGVTILLIADGRRDMQALLRDRLLNRDTSG